ncbi:MAG TPA: alpha/beta fold hydrolase [Candidatus Saccharimonadales bacterium]|nr:alpha/beta fold hydrolase [Candidatus Saccharimonadales bacterium]
MEPVHVIQDSKPLYMKGSKTGVLMLHGFTGAPQGVQFWAYYIAHEGYTVSCPLLPGHGKTWQELNKTKWTEWYSEVVRAFTELKKECDTVFVMGLSMGGTLSLKLAEDYPDQIRGLVLVNPSIMTLDKRAKYTPLVKWIIPSIKGIGSDIKKFGARELAYHRFPLRAFDSLRELWEITRNDLRKITTPVLIYHSTIDHVVEPENTKIILQDISSTQKEERWCQNSFHVATLDNDAQEIFTGSIDFMKKFEPAPVSQTVSHTLAQSVDSTKI